MARFNFKRKSELRKGCFFLLLISLGIILRLYKWADYSFWYDECQWLVFWENNLWSSIINSIYINKPPLFKFLLYGWASLAKNEFSLRLLPVFFSLASIILSYRVGKLLCDKKTALVCCLLMLFSPFHIYYAQELTHYSLTLFLSLCSIYYFVILVQENKKTIWVKFFLFTSLAFYTNYMFIFLWLVENIYWLAILGRNKRLLKSWLICQLLLLIAYLPLILATINMYLNFPLNFNHKSWIPQGSLLYILQTLRIFNVGYNATFVLNLTASLLAGFLLLSSIFVQLREKKQSVILLASWLFLPMLLSILFSKFYHTFIYRNFIFVLPAYYLLLAKGILNCRRFIYLPMVIFLALSGLSLINYYQNFFPYPEQFYRTGVHAKKDNRACVDYINKNFQKGDMVVHLSLSTTTPYFYYSSVNQGKNQGGKYFTDDIKILKPAEGGYFFPTGSQELIRAIKNVFPYNFVARVQEAAIYKISELLLIESDDPEILKLFINSESKRIWLVISAWEYQNFNVLLENSSIKRWLEDKFEMLDSRRFKDIEIRLHKIF